MRRRIQHHATLCLAVFVVGALLLPFAHEFTHIRSLEHTHGAASTEFSLRTSSSVGADADDFVVEERTVPHNPNCEICARLTLDAPPASNLSAFLDFVDVHSHRRGTPPTERVPGGCPIRAPPVVS